KSIDNAPLFGIDRQTIDSQRQLLERRTRMLQTKYRLNRGLPAGSEKYLESLLPTHQEPPQPATPVIHAAYAPQKVHCRPTSHSLFHSQALSYATKAYRHRLPEYSKLLNPKTASPPARAIPPKLL